MMNHEFCIIAGIVLGLIFTEITNISPGGVIVPGYLALSIQHPLDIALSMVAALAVMLIVSALSRVFFVFARRRYVLCILLGLAIKLLAEYFFVDQRPFGSGIQIIGWLAPGIIANDMIRQGIGRTILGAATVSSLVVIASVILL
jgi:poly-gamma-glutamate biosynthesis protein PgsC/CapC